MRRAIALSLLLGCEAAESEPPDFAELEPPERVVVVDAPETREAFLLELAPMPVGAVRIAYDVTGPGGMVGSLEVLAAAGGFRRETWTLELPTAAGDPIPIAGSTIVTPDRSWTDAVDGPAVVRELPLGPIADAYVKLPSTARSDVASTLRRFHSELAEARRTRPGTRAEVLGRDCLVTRVAAHRVCVWEETGLPLQYTGAAFDIVAHDIETDVALPERAFELPADGKHATDDPALDAGKSLERLAAGDVAELAVLLQPGLRPPPA